MEEEEEDRRTSVAWRGFSFYYDGTFKIKEYGSYFSWINGTVYMGCQSALETVWLV